MSDNRRYFTVHSQNPLVVNEGDANHVGIPASLSKAELVVVDEMARRAMTLAMDLKQTRGTEIEDVFGVIVHVTWSRS